MQSCFHLKSTYYSYYFPHSCSVPRQLQPYKVLPPNLSLEHQSASYFLWITVIGCLTDTIFTLKLSGDSSSYETSQEIEVKALL